MSMNFLQKENRMKGIPDATLKQMLIQMNQTGQVGTPEHILVAGELLDRKRTEQQAAIGKENKTPVIQDILNYVTAPQQPAMPPQQMAQAPAEAGIAAMRAPSAEQEFAAGGIVAFQKGGITLTDEQVAALMKAAQAKGRDLNPEFVVRAARDYDPAELKTLFDALGVPFDTPIPTAAPVDVPALAPAPAGMDISDTGAQMGAAPVTQAAGLPAIEQRSTAIGAKDIVPSRLMRLFGAKGPEVNSVFDPGAQPVYDTSRGQVAPSALSRLISPAPQTDPGYIPPEGLAAQRQSVLGLTAQTSGVVPPPAEPPKEDDKPTVTRIDKPEAPKAGLTALPKPDATGIMGIAQQFAGKAPDEITTTDKQAVEDQFKLYKEMGVDLDPYKKIKERLANADTEYEKQKNEAGLLALANFGFTWASTAGKPLAAAAKAGQSIMPGVMEAVKDLRKLKREDEKLGAEIAAFDSRMAKDITDKARADLQAKKNRVEDRRNAVQDNAARIGGDIYGRQLASETTLAATEMTTNATIAKLTQQLGETTVKNIVDAATKMVTADPRYALAKPADKDKMLSDAIQAVSRARLAAGTTVTPSK